MAIWEEYEVDPKFRESEVVNHRGRKAEIAEVIPVFWGAFEYVIVYSDSAEQVNYVREEEIEKWSSISSENKVCTHPNKYKNVLSANLSFWVCPDCKKDLGDV